MTQRQIISHIKKWLKVEGNTRSKLASLLGYNSRSTVTNWLTRGRVPVYQHKNIFNATKKGRKQ